MSNSVLNRAMAAAVLRMRGVAGEPLDFKVYPGAIVVIAPDGRKFNAGLDAVREFIDRERLDTAATDESGEAHRQPAPAAAPAAKQSGKKAKK